jgi:hypothetical protein
MATMLDLLLGSPGESEATLGRTLDLMKRIAPDRVGVALGIRVYPSTPLAEHLSATRSLGDVADPDNPVFYTDPQVADTASDQIDRAIAGDQRFFFYDPARPDRDYNYNANEVLTAAIRDGHRGAYWDILRRVAEGIPPQGDA